MFFGTENTSVAKQVGVVSLPVNVCSFESVVERIGKTVEQGSGAYICMSTVHMIMESYDDPEYGAKISAADMIVPDGMPLVWMQRLKGFRDAGRVRGNDLMIGLCEYAEKKGLSVGFYGGRAEVVQAILERAAVDYPKLNIAYAYSPPFRNLSKDEDQRIVTELLEQKPDILFVGLGCPKQERWMYSHRERIPAVMIGIGAAFDMFAGNLAVCPKSIQDLGLEWLFRLWQEPRRLWKRYFFNNPRFILLAVSQLLGFRKVN